MMESFPGFLGRMARLGAVALVSVCLAAGCCAGVCGKKGDGEASRMKVGSYNIRYRNAGDSLSGNAWSVRSPYLIRQLAFEEPDIFGCQEVLHAQLLDLAAGLPGYDYVGVGRDDGLSAGEHEPIFWRRDRFKLLDKGWFWLSETPGEPSLGWDAACIRICTWVCLRDKASGKTIRFYNLHMDHVGVTARREGAKLVVRRIASQAQPYDCVFVTGDFNVDQTNEIYGIFTQSGFLDDSYTKAALRLAPNGTFNAYNVDNFTEFRIDHVFVSSAVSVEAYAVRTDTYHVPVQEGEALREGDFPKEVFFRPSAPRLFSDHYPVFVKVSL